MRGGVAEKLGGQLRELEPHFSLTQTRRQPGYVIIVELVNLRIVLKCSNYVYENSSKPAYG